MVFFCWVFRQGFAGCEGFLCLLFSVMLCCFVFAFPCLAWFRFFFCFVLFSFVGSDGIIEGFYARWRRGWRRLPLWVWKLVMARFSQAARGQLPTTTRNSKNHIGSFQQSSYIYIYIPQPSLVGSLRGLEEDKGCLGEFSELMACCPGPGLANLAGDDSTCSLL